jgi:hypothetical protein
MTRSYQSVSVLGSYCQAAHQTRRLAENVVKGPLDWVFVRRTGLMRCIASDFEGLGRWDNLIVTADLERIKDSVFGVDFFHQFQRDELHRVRVYDLRNRYELFLEKLNALIRRYRSIQGDHLFVWAVDRWFLEGVPARQAASDLLHALRVRKPKCDLLVVQADAPPEPAWGDGLTLLWQFSGAQRVLGIPTREFA